jgi:hypothetical protein
MVLNKNKKIIAIIALLSMIFVACAPSQKVIDNILPEYNRRIYSIADLIPYSYKELRNAQALYGTELTKFFYENTSTAAEVKRVTENEKNSFYKELRFRNTNYKLLRNRLAMYTEDAYKSQKVKEEERQKEYDDYYKLSTAKGGNTIKKYNNGNLQGMPLMSIRVVMSTATMSDLDSIYSEAECEIYKPVVIDESKYNSLKIGDKIELEVPVENSTFEKSETKKVECTYVAEDSLMFTDENGKDDYYFIADIDGTNDYCRRITDYYGKSLEVYVEKKTLQFMKSAAVARANESQRLMNAIADDSYVAYDFDKLAIRALGGGYYVWDYKDYVYANSITTNLKGYITALYYYDNLRIDNKYYEELNK